MPEKRTIELPPDTQEGFERFLRIMSHLRGQSRLAVDLWTDSAERETGGTLLLQAPLLVRGNKEATRDVPNAGYATELFTRHFPRVAG